MNANVIRSGFREICEIALMAAVMAVCSWISIPTTVPFTLQTFGVFMAVRLLGGRNGTIAIMLYLLVGLVGMPVFAGFSGGASALIGPTGGYLIGFLFISGLYWALEKHLNKWLLKDITLYAGLLLCYAAGTAWFMYTTGNSLITSLTWCVLPFLLPDAGKLILSELAASQLERALRLRRTR